VFVWPFFCLFWGWCCARSLHGWQQHEQGALCVMDAPPIMFPVLFVCLFGWLVVRFGMTPCSFPSAHVVCLFCLPYIHNHTHTHTHTHTQSHTHTHNHTHTPTITPPSPGVHPLPRPSRGRRPGVRALLLPPPHRNRGQQPPRHRADDQAWRSLRVAPRRLSDGSLMGRVHRRGFLGGAAGCPRPNRVLVGRGAAQLVVWRGRGCAGCTGWCRGAGWCCWWCWWWWQ